MSIQYNPKLQEAIVQSIVDVVDGMFLLAKLHVESLTDKTTPKAIKKALEMLPTGSDALDIAYSQAMQRVESQKPGFKNLAKRALGWVIYACRLLTVSELRHTLAIEVGTSAFDEENVDDIEEIVSVCCGLIAIDPETSTVRLVHYTTQEYFKKTGSEHFPDATEDVAASCLTYLLYDAFGTGWTRCKLNPESEPEESRPIEARLVKYQFLGYSACFWAQHAAEYSINVEHRVRELLARFFADDFKVSSAAQALFNVKGVDLLRFGDECPSPTPTFGIHLAALFNLSRDVLDMIGTGRFAADAEDQHGRTSLMYATYMNNNATVRVLVHRPDVDVNKMSSMDPPRSILTSATQHGHSETVELLLEREDIKINTTGFHNTPLVFAIISGHDALVRLLLRHKNTMVDYQESEIFTLLIFAVAMDRLEAVRLLLSPDRVDPNQRQADGMTLLALVATYGHTEIAKLLLERQDVDVNSKDNDGYTVLQYARGKDMKELIRTAIQERSGTTDEQASETE